MNTREFAIDREERRQYVALTRHAHTTVLLRSSDKIITVMMTVGQSLAGLEHSHSSTQTQTMPSSPGLGIPCPLSCAPAAEKPMESKITACPLARFRSQHGMVMVMIWKIWYSIPTSPRHNPVPSKRERRDQISSPLSLIHI